MALIKKIIWAPSASEDLTEAFKYIQADNPAAANQFVQNIMGQTEKLARFPKIGRVIPEIGSPRYRELIVGEYRIFHEVSKHQLTIFRVFHSKRLFSG